MDKCLSVQANQSCCHKFETPLSDPGVLMFPILSKYVQ